MGLILKFFNMGLFLLYIGLVKDYFIYFRVCFLLRVILERDYFHSVFKESDCSLVFSVVLLQLDVQGTVPASRSINGTDCWPTILTMIVLEFSWIGFFSLHAVFAGRTLNRAGKFCIVDIEIKHFISIFC